MMTQKIHEKSGVFVPTNSHFSCFVSITFPQPTIRIKIPKVLVKAMQRKNQTQTENDKNGSKNKGKYWATSKKSFQKKVGSMFSTVFGKKKLVPETDSEGKNGDIGSNGDDEEMKLKTMIERVDLESEKITRKGNEDKLDDGIQQQKAAAGDEGKNTNVDDIIVGHIDSSVACIVGEKGAKHTFRTKGIESQEKGGNFKDLSRFRSKTLSSYRKLKTAWWTKKMASVVMGGRKSEKQELWNKRILMGGKCRPVNDSSI